MMKQMQGAIKSLVDMQIQMSKKIMEAIIKDDKKMEESGDKLQKNLQNGRGIVTAGDFTDGFYQALEALELMGQGGLENQMARSNSNLFGGAGGAGGDNPFAAFMQ